jgi:gliding motility-associated-like protein
MKIKSLIIFVIACIINISIGYSQTNHNLDATSNGTTITSCNANLYDSGGPAGTYQNSEDYSITFCSGTTDCLQLQFIGAFGVEQGWDHVYLYDGNSIASNLLADLDGTALPTNYSSSGSCITIRFTSDGSVTLDGFQVKITCTTACYIPPPPPTNDDPCTAFSLTVNANCNFTQYTCANATNTTLVAAPTCGVSYMGGDVWFSAVVPASGNLGIQIGPQIIIEGGIALYSGANCNTLTEIMCNEQTWGMPSSQLIGVGLGMAGQTVWIRVWEPGNDNPGIFDICAFEPPPPPANDDPCGAFSLTVNANCVFTQYSAMSATGTISVPAPTCAFSYSGGDIWFSAIVPPSGLLAVQLGPQMMIDAGIALYSGTNCNTLTQITCEEPWSGMPGTQYVGNSLGLAGQTVWIRIWEISNDNANTFDICAFEPPPFLEVDTSSYNPTQLVQDILITGCVSATNITYTGEDAAIGYFQNGLGSVGFDRGIIMSTGNASDAFGSGTSTLAATSFNTPGDPQLNAIIAPTNTNDAAILEFDFVPSSDTLKFNFVFGSEEYPEYVPSFNDVFAFFLSGPNPSGGNYTGQNIALIPGTNTPVSIYNVNNGAGSPPIGPCVNCAYYVDNYAGTYPVTLDGYTIPITAQALVVPCQTYHIKLAIADAGDATLDSQVYLEAGSFSSGGDIAFNHFSSIAISDEVLEGCDNYFVFSRLDTIDLTDSIHVQLNISGTALNGTDYTSIPTSFWIHAGELGDTIHYSAILDNLVETTEYFTISLTNGCPCSLTTVSDTIFILNNYTLNPHLSNDTTVCAGQPVTLTAVVNPNIDPTLINYLWSTGDTTLSITVSPIVTTTYTVSINDPCVQDTLMQVTVTMVPPLTPLFTVSTDTVCLNQPTIAQFGGTAGPSAIYLWNFNGGTPASASTAGPHNISWATTGLKTITLSINDNGCSGTAFKNVEVLSNPTASFATSPAICYGTATGSITTTETGQITPYVYIWNNGSTLQNPTNLIAGNYTVTIANSYGCSTIQNSSISQPTSINSTTSSTPVSCFGGANGTATVTASGGTIPYSFLWNDGMNQTTQTSSNLIAGTYINTVTDNNGCTLTSTAIVTQPSSYISVSGTPTDVLCAGSTNGTITTNAIGGVTPYTYLWSNGSTTSDLNNLTIGSYTVTVRDANGCTISNSWSINSPLPVSFTGTVTNATCWGYSNGNIILNVINGTPPYYYLWSDNSTNTSLNGVFAGNYSVTITDANNCSINGNYVINQPEKVSVSITSNQTICIGQSATINSSITGGTAPYVLHWNNGSNQNSITVSPSTTTSYQLSAVDSKQCISNVANVTITVNPEITATFEVSAPQVCQGESVHITIHPQGGNGNYSYLLNGNAMINPVNVFPSQSMTYNILVKDDCGSPTTTLNIPIIVKPLPPVNFYADSIQGCEPLMVHFNEPNIDFGQSYLWNFGDGSNNMTSTEKNPTHKFENDGTYSVDLQVTSPEGCKNHFSINNYISVFPRPEARFIAEPNTANIITPTIHFINLSTDNFQSFWNFEDGDSSLVTNPWHTFATTPAYYNVTLITKTDKGCLDSSSLMVQIINEYTFYAPNAFSPDNDGKNDFFFVLGHGVVTETFSLKIFDRWGTVLWGTKNYTDQWNGETKSGKKAPIGSYAWMVKYNDETGIHHEYSGSVTIVR